MKKKSAGDLMNDPFYSRIMFEIESLVHKRDEEALEGGLRLTDSNVKSAIRKTLGMFAGNQHPSKARSNPSERPTSPSAIS